MAGVRPTLARRRTAPAAQEPSRQEIARLAYELFERRGRVHGFDQQDWFEAERIVHQRQSR